MITTWQQYLKILTTEQKEKLLREFIKHHIDKDIDSEIKFREELDDQNPCFFWDASGDPLI